MGEPAETAFQASQSEHLSVFGLMVWGQWYWWDLHRPMAYGPYPTRAAAVEACNTSSRLVSQDDEEDEDDYDSDYDDPDDE